MDFPVVYFRPIQKEDDDVVAALIRRCLQEFAVEGPGFASSDRELDHLFSHYEACANSVYYVVEAEGEILGGGGLSPLKKGSPGICELQKMYLLPKARGYGLGAQLLSFLKRRAERFGYKTLYLETHSSMTQAKKLYLNFGFEPLEHPMGATGHTGCNEWFVCGLESG